MKRHIYTHMYTKGIKDLISIQDRYFFLKKNSIKKELSKARSIIEYLLCYKYSIKNSNQCSRKFPGWG